MTNNELYARLFQFNPSTYYRWKKEGRPILNLLEMYFNREDLEEFVATGRIEKFEKPRMTPQNRSNRSLRSSEAWKDVFLCGKEKQMSIKFKVIEGDTLETMEVERSELIGRAEQYLSQNSEEINEALDLTSVETLKDAVRILRWAGDEVKADVKLSFLETIKNSDLKAIVEALNATRCCGCDNRFYIDEIGTGNIGSSLTVVIDSDDGDVVIGATPSGMVGEESVLRISLRIVYLDKRYSLNGIYES